MEKPVLDFCTIFTAVAPSGAPSHVGEQLHLVDAVLARARAVGGPQVRLPEVVDAVVHVLVDLHVL